MTQARARRTDPVTSHQAAASIDGERIRLSQHAVLRHFRRHGPMTVRAYDPMEDMEHWHGPLSKLSAVEKAQDLEGKWMTRI
jgi:hypothetical protein